MDTSKLTGSTAFITGASRGIGKAIAIALGKAGANVALFAKTGEPHPKLPGTVYETAEEIEAVGGKALPIIGDVRDEEAVADAVKKTAETFGGIDLCVNNASALNLNSLGEMEPKRYDLIQQINTRGTYLTTHYALPYLRESSHAHVLTLSPPLSTDAKWFAPGPYTASKFSMTIMTLGVSESESDNGIAANCLWPKTTIATAAVRYGLGGQDMIDRSRSVDLVSDAALAILSRNPSDYTGHATLAEDVLHEEGIDDLSPYSVVEGQTDFHQDLYVEKDS
ncbi:SDR family oxidoreductase [Haloglycomyces albus]|uniref:SDR family oxidoreductase n=1 Tax=Haloglycomyces albus TaxID=526067 RepID=UPI00046CC958|nr:NAD(P)-dependent oxidoreductase [Haloglycomyces albus]